MTKDKQEVYVWECIFYTEDENGGITYYEAPNADWSTVAECVEVEDLLEIKPEAILAYEKVRLGVGVKQLRDTMAPTCGDKNDPLI